MNNLLKTFFDRQYLVSPMGITTDTTTMAPATVMVFDTGEPTSILLKREGVNIYVNYGLFLLNAFNKFRLPFEFWGHADVGFLNDNVKDFSIENLYVRYPEGPVEHPGLKNFFYIPGYEVNLINKNGKLHRLNTGATLDPYTYSNIEHPENFYPTHAIHGENDVLVTRSLHRLLAITFLSEGYKYPLLQVNHKDADKTNFQLSNLEWVTPRENNLHAVNVGSRPDNINVLIKDIETGEIMEFASITEAGRVLDCGVSVLSSVYSGVTRIFKNRYLVKGVDDETTWEELESRLGKKDVLRVKAKHYETGEIREFTSVKSAGRNLGVSTSSIIRQIKGITPIKNILKGWEVKDLNDDSPWKVFNEHEINIYKLGLDARTAIYELRDVRTNETQICYGWRPVSRITGVVKRTIVVVGNMGGKIGKYYEIRKLEFNN